MARAAVAMTWIWRYGETLRAGWPGGSVTFRARHVDPNEIPF